MASTRLPMVALTLAAVILLADITTAAGAWGPEYGLTAAEKQVTSAQPPRNAHRKLMQASISYDYVTVFCEQQGIQTRRASWLAGFSTTAVYVAINTCGGQKVRTLNSNEDLYTPSVKGTVTETAIPGGRSISWHVEGSNVFAFVVDAFFDPRTSARFDDATFSESSNLFLGTNIEGEGFLARGLSKEDLQTILSTASFVWDYSFTVRDGSKPGDPFTPDTLNDPTAAIVRDEITATISGLLRFTNNLRYRPAQPAVATFHQVNVGATQGTGPFDFPGSPETAVQTEFDLSILPPIADPAREVFLQDLLRPPPPTAAPAATTAAPVVTTSAPVATTAAPVVTTSAPAATTAAPAATTSAPTVGLPVGGVCDPSSGLPNQCYSAGGDRYVCCPNDCPYDPMETPRCT